MIAFVVRRLLYGLLVLLGVIVVVFLLFNVLPGDPARLLAGQRTDAETLAAINRDLGLDRSMGAQFLIYLNDLSPVSIHQTEDPATALHFSEEKYSGVLLFGVGGGHQLALKYPYLRQSYQSRRKVADIIRETLPETAVLAFAAVFFATTLGIGLGLFAALRKGSWYDNLALILSALGVSGPTFFVGILVVWVGAYLLGEYTGFNLTGSLYTFDEYGDKEVLSLKNLVLPAFTLGLRPLAVVVQLTRSSVLEVLEQDYIRTAKAKGLGFIGLVFRHTLKNALNPVLTAISGWLASLMAGAVFVEYIFGWKGIGNEIISALDRYDLPVIMGSVLVITTIFVAINLLVDIAYGFLDPRVRFS